MVSHLKGLFCLGSIRQLPNYRWSSKKVMLHLSRANVIHTLRFVLAQKSLDAAAEFGSDTPIGFEHLTD